MSGQKAGEVANKKYCVRKGAVEELEMAQVRLWSPQITIQALDLDLGIESAHFQRP